MADSARRSHWWQRGWDDIRPNLFWWAIQTALGSGIITGAYAIIKNAANQTISWFWAVVVFSISFAVFISVSLFVHSQQDKRYGKLKGAFTAMMVYLPIVLGVGFCVWAYSVGATLSRLDRETRALRSNIDLYFKPRSLSEEQITSMAAGLSKVDSQNIALVVHANDAEAANYMGQIAGGLIRGGWKITRTSYSVEQMNQGVSINVEFPGQPVNPDPKHPRPDEILNRAMNEAKIVVNGSGAVYNRAGYAITLTIGPRQMILDSTPPPPRPQIPPPPGWQ